MTSTLAHGAARGHGEPARPLRALAASPALVLLLLGGLALRLTIAYVLFPSSGFESDITSYAVWALTLAEHGPAGFYANISFSDYPPAYLYLLWPVGLLASGMADPLAAASALIKVPPMLLDLAVGYLIYRLVRGWTHPGPRAGLLGLAAGALYLFNPVVIYDSALWGQTDAAGALVILLGVAALIRGNSEAAFALAVVAALVKPQFGVVLIPLVAIVLLRRHLVAPGSGPRHPPWAPRILATRLARTQGWPRLVTALLAGLGTFALVAMPFGMGPLEYLQRMIGTAGGYSYLSVNAFNPWALAGSGETPPLAASLSWSDDTIGFLGPVPAVVIGALLLAAGYLWGVLRAAARDDRWSLLVAATFLAIAFFVLPTRVHERYIFPAFALLPILAVGQARWAAASLVLTVGAFINLHAILTIPVYGTENVTSLPLGETFRSPPFIVLSALVQSGVGAWAAWQLRPTLRTRPDPFARLASPPPGPLTGDPDPSASGPTEPARPEAWVAGPSALDWIAARFSRVPLRRDRSAELTGEGSGRLDRLDLVAVIVLVVLALTLRGFRLDQPMGMYFDEVYHARTATEFLQHWEYGEAHDIYEFTHPHLAKYAMAWGIRLAGGNEVTDTLELGVPVRGAALERAWSSAPPAGGGGDRLYIATGEELRAYDLGSGVLLDAFPVAATSLAIDEVEHRLFMADPRGAILALDTTALDGTTADGAQPALPQPLGPGPGAPVHSLAVGEGVLVAVTGGSISTFDAATGSRLAERLALGTSVALPLPAVERLVADPAAVGDPEEAAAQLAELLDDEPRRLARRLSAVDGELVVEAWLDEEERTAVSEAIVDGRLPGIRLEHGALLAAGGADGIDFLDVATLDVVEVIETDAPVEGLAIVGRSSEPTLYAAAGTQLHVVSLGEDGPGLPTPLPMPGAVRDVVWNEPANLVHVLGEAPEGGPTVYIVEPNGNAVFIDVPLPAEPAHLLADTQPQRPADDRSQLLAIAPDGHLASVEIGRNAFGWRIPGVLLGALAAALLYLLARRLFARRAVALIAGALVIAEGMLFANSRIAMNDVYVTTFVIAGVLLLTPLLLHRPRPPTALLALLAAGMALGLALASKWVALYAIGGLVLLVLLRSALGRIIALIGMVGLTAVLGAMAVRPAPTDDPNRNWAFLLLMLLLTALLTAGIVRRPLSLTRGELGLAVVVLLVAGLGSLGAGALGLAGSRSDEGGPVGAGGMSGLVAPDRLLAVGAVAVVLGLGALVLSWAAGRLGRGPLSERTPRTGHVASSWLLPARVGGIAWLITLAILVLVPIGVYIVSYAPWVELGNGWGMPLVGGLPFLPSGSETGQTLPELTASMYQYHDDLRAEHAASSPWWAWPLDLKPVWFYQERFAGATTGLIYDAGNLVVFWLGVPAMAFAAWAAWRRHSLSLAIVVVMWAALWLPWARIDRATFQYHVYASLPFVVLALAYFLAELWHGPGPRTWLVARVAVALAILGAPLLWLLRAPLCILAGTALAHPEGVACASEVSRTAQLSQAGLAAVLVAAAGAAIGASIGWKAARAHGGRSPGSQRSPGSGGPAAWLVALVLVAVVTLLGVLGSLALLDGTSVTTLTLSSDALALLALAILAIPALMVMRARDARRVVLVVLAAALLWLLLWYPNLSALPLPDGLAHVYQQLLPTWTWDFQFAVNTDAPTGGGILDGSSLIIGALTAGLVVGVAVVARAWGAPADRRDEAPAYRSLPETPPR